MSETVVAVLGSIEEKHGSNDKGPWTRYTFLDDAGKVLGASFNPPLADAAKTLIGQSVELEVKPASNPKFAADVLTIKPAEGDTPSTNGGSPGLTKDEWRAKDRAADKRACIAIAAGALTHTLPGQPTDDDLAAFGSRVLRLSQTFADAVIRARGDNPDDQVPF